jgi:SAM-dependent methyltransferase
MYHPPLAHAHTTGFAAHARGALPAVLRRLAAGPVSPRRVYDLGCGAGETTRALAAAGYDAIGIDVSAAMIDRARASAASDGAPARFIHASLYDVALDPCVGLVAIGEPLTYHRPEVDAYARLTDLFGRAAAALVPGGLFTFDVIARSPEGPTLDATGARKGEGFRVEWTTRDLGHRLERHIRTTARIDGVWSESTEVHHVAVFDAPRLVSLLGAVGFEATVSTAYDDFALAVRRIAVFATRMPS